jgi:hypothetical protein
MFRMYPSLRWSEATCCYGDVMLTADGVHLAPLRTRLQHKWRRGACLAVAVAVTSCTTKIIRKSQLAALASAL